MNFFTKLFRRSPRTIVTDAPAQPVRGSYDVTRGGNETLNLWGGANSLDADACNSLAVRRKLRNWSREERANNGHCSGIISTHTNYIIGTGPKLRMLTRSPRFNQMVEMRWKQWCRDTRFMSKLRTMGMAKTTDGEVFAVLTDNPRSTNPVSLDLHLVECDQVTAPVMNPDSKNYVDGIRFDNFGNPIFYDVLRQHPGSVWYSSTLAAEHDTIPAKFVLHWFSANRPGQHRGIPDLTPSLSLFGTSRRFREAVLAAAETAADFSAMVEMGIADEGNDVVRPFTSLPIEKRMLVMMPAGARVAQMKAEQPPTTYESFNRQNLCEEARPLNMPYNIAACDSSGYSFSGGQLDHQTYFVSIAVERQNCVFDVVDRVYAVWFEQAVGAYGWKVPDSPAPHHGWMFNKKPQNDPVKTANSRKISLSCGVSLISDIFAEDGEDYEDKVEQMAADYGVTVEVLKAKLFQSVFQQSGGAPDKTGADEKEDEEEVTENKNSPSANASGNGDGRLSQYMQGA